MTVRTQKRCSEVGSYANGRQPGTELTVLRKIAIIRLKFRVHPGNPGYTETPLYT
jgi:ribosomal protein S14